LRHVLAALLAAAAWPVAALETRCVDTEGELDAAVRLAVDDDVEIHLVRGTYDIAGTILTTFGFEEPEPDDDLAIIGGYAPGCGSRTLDPYGTTLVDSSGEGMLIEGGENSGHLRLESLRLQGFSSYLKLGAFESGGYVLTLSRVVVEEGDVALKASEIRVSNSVFTGRSGSATGCVVYVDSYTPYYGFSMSMIHTVVADNDGIGLCIHESSSSWDAALYNNVFWNNSGVDISTDTPDDETDLTLINNIRQSMDLSEPLLDPEIGGLNQNPQFSDDPNAPFRPVPASPAVNSGVVLGSSLTGEDVDGGPRWIGSHPDRGAYETNVDDTNGLTVTTTADQIAPLITGSLRWAVAQSNNDPDTNTIRFNIAGGCPRIIDLVAPLPDITDRVIIDGYTQPGSEPNTSSISFNATICVGVRGDLSDDHALYIPSSVGAAQSLNVSGIGFGGFDVAAIRIAGGAGSWIHGNQFGGELEGVALGNSSVNVRIGGASYYNLIGGEEPEMRNLVAFAWSAGIELLDNSSGTDGYQNYVTNNFIGTSASGMDYAPNALGVRVRTRGNRIEDNVISGNLGHGVFLEGALADENYIVDNRIGLKSFAICVPQPCDPDFSLGNLDMGVLVQGGGSRNTINSNIVAYNGQKGIRLFDGQRNKLLHNRVYENASLGIDLGIAGVNPVYNAGDPDTLDLPNRGINAPAIAYARGSQHDGHVVGIFASSDGSYILQVFDNESCDASGRGEGQRVLTTALTSIDNQQPGSNGSVVFDVPFHSNASLQPRYITAVATDAQGNSSEFSDCQSYDCDTIFKHSLDSTSAERCDEP
jgi:parallel beta-helix repeat protein